MTKKELLSLIKEAFQEIDEASLRSQQEFLNSIKDKPTMELVKIMNANDHNPMLSNAIQSIIDDRTFSKSRQMRVLGKV